MVLQGNAQDSLKFGKHKQYNADGFLKQGSRVKVARKTSLQADLRLSDKNNSRVTFTSENPSVSYVIQFAPVAVKGLCSHVC